MDIPPKPHSRNIHQQKLWHVYAQYKPVYVALTLLICAVCLIPCGVAVIVYSDRNTELDVRYDNISDYVYTVGGAGVNAVDFNFGGSTFSTGKVVKVNLTLKKSLSAPVYIEYRVRNFYQNYRLFLASFSIVQMYGRGSNLPDDCKPFRWPGENIDDRQSGYYNPCGALAWSMFNDSLSLYSADGTLICAGDQFSVDGESLISQQCRKKGIALKSDVDKIYQPPHEMKDAKGPMWTHAGDTGSSDPFLQAGYYYGEPGHRIPLSTDEDYIVWVNAGYLADFAKMYRIVDKDLPAGDYYFEITENFDVVSFNGEKHVKLVTRNWIGGRHHVLGILMTVVGSVSFVFAVCVMLISCVKYHDPNTL